MTNIRSRLKAEDPTREDIKTVLVPVGPIHIVLTVSKSYSMTLTIITPLTFICWTHHLSVINAHTHTLYLYIAMPCIFSSFSNVQRSKISFLDNNLLEGKGFCFCIPFWSGYDLSATVLSLWKGLRDPDSSKKVAVPLRLSSTGVILFMVVLKGSHTVW